MPFHRLLWTGITLQVNVGEKIEVAARDAGITLAELLRQAKLNRNYVKSLRKNPDQSPGLKNIRAIASLTGKPVEWFVPDDVPPPPPSRTIIQAKRTLKPIIPTEPSQVHVAEIDARISAGGGSVITQEEARRYWSVPRSFIDSMNLDPGQMAFVEVVGDSMYPTLWPGDLVLLDLRANQPGAAKNIYAAWDSDATVCKRIQRIPDDDTPKLRFISDNATYAPYDVPEDWARVIGRVVWFARQI